ncbi:MAG: hypothetical protein LUQ69_03705 [Methanoregulaceae archaeon]|nr:hypothetical protein [Methanoregulaceae archaeon]
MPRQYSFWLICVRSFAFIDGMGGGYAIAFVSFFLAISSVVVFLLFVYRARVMDTILADPSPLAHWICLEEMARSNLEREYREFQGWNRAMFIIIGGMLVVVACFSSSPRDCRPALCGLGAYSLAGKAAGDACPTTRLSSPVTGSCMKDRSTRSARSSCSGTV